MEKLENQQCPMCGKYNLTLSEEEVNIPEFGIVFSFGMDCSECGFSKHDVEAEEPQGPLKYSFNVESEEDLKANIIKSAEAKVNIPYITSMEPGPSAQGFITTIEELLQKVKQNLEDIKENSEDSDEKKKTWKLIKKINRVLWGDEKVKVIIEDPAGNSAIVSQKANKTKLKS
mgnify:CR=1 FL=1